MIFFVEDGPHKALLRSLGIGRRDVRIMGSKGNVMNGLKKCPGNTGMVDEDPANIQGQPHELAYYREVEKGEELRLLAHTGGGGQRLVVLCPRVEDWLMQRAEVCGIDLRRYHVPETPKELHARPQYEEKEWFVRFLAELSSRDGGMGLLRQWVH